MSKHKKLTECPKCGCGSIHLLERVATVFLFRRSRVINSNSVKARCNKPDCDQLFWYYPNTSKVTRRNK